MLGINVEFSWVDDYLKTQNNENQLQGYYNQNYKVSHNEQIYLLRIPIQTKLNLDFRIIPEKEILVYLEKKDFRAPRFIYSNSQYSLHSWITGTNLQTIFPRNSKLPDWIVLNLADQMKTLHHLPIAEFSKQYDVFSEFRAPFFYPIFSNIWKIQDIKRNFLCFYLKICLLFSKKMEKNWIKETKY